MQTPGVVIHGHIFSHISDRFQAGSVTAIEVAPFLWTAEPDSWTSPNIYDTSGL